MIYSHIFLIYGFGHRQRPNLAFKVGHTLNQHKSELGIIKATTIKDPLFALFIDHLKQKYDSDSKLKRSVLLIHWDKYSTEVNLNLDTILRDTITEYEPPVGAHFFYLIQTDKVPRFHYISRLITNDEIKDDDKIKEAEILTNNADLFHRYYTGQPMTGDQQALIAKLLLSSDKSYNLNLFKRT